MSEREQAARATQKPGRSPPKDPARPTAQEIFDNVPGARSVDPKFLSDDAKDALKKVTFPQPSCFGGEEGRDHDWKGAGASLPGKGDEKPSL